jgi:hypothetical protein
VEGVSGISRRSYLATGRRLADLLAALESIVLGGGFRSDLGGALIPPIIARLTGGRLPGRKTA